jgi:hypothetical protein
LPCAASSWHPALALHLDPSPSTTCPGCYLPCIASITWPTNLTLLLSPLSPPHTQPCAQLGIGARYITVSTVGVPNAIPRLGRANLKSTLAVSIHAPNQVSEPHCMLLQHGWPASRLLSCLPLLVLLGCHRRCCCGKGADHGWGGCHCGLVQALYAWRCSAGSAAAGLWCVEVHPQACELSSCAPPCTLLLQALRESIIPSAKAYPIKALMEVGGWSCSSWAIACLPCPALHCQQLLAVLLRPGFRSLGSGGAVLG